MCFLGGTLALGAHNSLSPDHLDLGKKITETCFQMYLRMPTGLSPEITYFNMAEGVKEDLIIKVITSPNSELPRVAKIRFQLENALISYSMKTRGILITLYTCIQVVLNSDLHLYSGSVYEILCQTNFQVVIFRL